VSCLEMFAAQRMGRLCKGMREQSSEWNVKSFMGIEAAKNLAQRSLRTVEKNGPTRKSALQVHLAR